ncbi:MAG: glycosyltransferase family 4 protein, partial [Planctomycetaceae bacterium]
LRVIAVSDAVRNHLVERYQVPRDLISVVSSGVMCNRAEPPPAILNPGKVPVVGTAGPLEAVKGFPYFLGAAAHVLATGRDVEFLIAGAGPEERNLRRLAQELGVTDHITFVPNLTDFDEALEATDIFCLPSLQQGLGTIMLEAMALGRPVIATRVGGVFQVIQDGKTGLLVPPTDSRQLADRILQLLDHPEEARRLGQSARAEVAGQFHVERMIEQTVKIYREVLESNALTTTSG